MLAAPYTGWPGLRAFVDAEAVEASVNDGLDGDGRNDLPPAEPKARQLAAGRQLLVEHLLLGGFEHAVEAPQDGEGEYDAPVLGLL